MVTSVFKSDRCSSCDAKQINKISTITILHDELNETNDYNDIITNYTLFKLPIHLLMGAQLRLALVGKKLYKVNKFVYI